MTEELPELEPFEDTPDTSAKKPGDDAAAMGAGGDDVTMPGAMPPPFAGDPMAEPAGAAAAPMAAGAPALAGAGGCLPAPAYNPKADKEYSRFLFAGMLMLIGCLMPWGGDTPGYHTLAGGFSLLIAVGMVWTWWGATATGRFGGANLKWVFLSVIPLLIQVLTLLSTFDYPEVKSYLEQTGMEEGWGFFGDLLKLDPENPDANLHARGLLALIGPGRFVVLFGALLAELFFLMAIFGGAKHAKKQKAAKAEAKAGARAGGGGGKGAGRSGGGRRR